MTARERYDEWVALCADAALRAELSDMAGDEGRISDRFFRELSFGTGGLRGEIGVGVNAMNVVTVARATRGLAKYLLDKYDSPSLAVCFDNRQNSALFARETARAASSMGVRVLLFPRLLPTPVLSYAVRALKCSGGVMITASHNPREYNGYKVYGDDGCQITDAAAAAIEREIAAMPYFGQAGEMRDELISPVPEGLLDDYLDMVCALAPGDAGKAARLRVVYTPLNGTGLEPVTKALAMSGFLSVFVAPEQRDPDPTFATCPYPNPEMPEAMAVGLSHLSRLNADLLLATDPDCDRVGAAILENGAPRLISGNEMGALLLDYVCRARDLPKNPVAVKTIVTTDMAFAIADEYGVQLREVLTGFKYIGETIAALEKQGRREDFVFGFEESYGYLSGTDVRDKDGVNAALLICRMAADLKARGMTISDALRDLEKRYGAFAQSLESLTFRGEIGMRRMAEAMDALRLSPPDTLMGRRVLTCADYLKQTVVDVDTGEARPTDLPRSNVLKWTFEEGFGVVVRPSGTEPKLKIYYTARAADRATAETLLNDWRVAFKETFSDLTNE